MQIIKLLTNVNVNLKCFVNKNILKYMYLIHVALPGWKGCNDGTQ